MFLVPDPHVHVSAISALMVALRRCHPWHTSLACHHPVCHRGHRCQADSGAFPESRKEGCRENELIEKFDRGDYKDYYDYYDGSEGNVGDVDFDDISDYFCGGND